MMVKVTTRDHQVLIQIRSAMLTVISYHRGNHKSPLQHRIAIQAHFTVVAYGTTVLQPKVPN